MCNNFFRQNIHQDSSSFSMFHRVLYVHHTDTILLDELKK